MIVRRCDYPDCPERSQVTLGILAFCVRHGIAVLRARRHRRLQRATWSA